MSERNGFLLLLGVMVVLAAVVGITTILYLYNTALEEHRSRLEKSARSSARFLETMTPPDANNGQAYLPGTSLEAILNNFRNANSSFEGLGETGEFLLARLENEQVVFLLQHPRSGQDDPAPVSSTSDFAEPMRLALSGHSGTMIGLDYRGETVLAAYEPVAGQNLAVVAKIDMDEIRAPFVRAGLMAGVIVLLFLLAGTKLLLRVANPVVHSLRGGEANYRLLVEKMTDGLGIIDKNSRFRYTNPALCKMVGRSADELIGIPAADIMTKKSRKTFKQETAARRQGGDDSYEMELTRKDGRKIPVIVSPTPLYADDGSFDGSFAVVTDISDRIENEKLLQESEEKYRAIFDNAVESIVIVDPKTLKFLDFNTETHTNLGYTREEFREFTVPDIKMTQSPDEVRAYASNILQNGFDKFETTHRTKDGQERNMLVSIKLISGIDDPKLIGVWHDITKLKQAELSQKEHHVFLQNIIDSFNHPFLVINANDLTVELSNAACDDIAKSDSSTCYQILYGMDKRSANYDSSCPIQKVIATGKPATAILSCKGDLEQPIYNQVWVYPILDKKQIVTHVCMYCEDVTVKQLAVSALQQSEERFRTVIDQAGDALFLVRLDGSFADVNKRACESLGYTREKLLELSVPDIDPVYPMDEIDDLAKSLDPDEPTTMESIHQRKDGSSFPVEMRVSLIQINDQPHMLVLARDITERKRAETTIAASLNEKKILLKEIHHRVKNNLQVISSLLHMQAENIQDEKTSAALLQSQSRVNSMSLIHEQLYMSSDLTSINLREYIESLAKGLFASYGADSKQLGLKIEVGEISMNIDTASSCGLIISELISNSIKHAFPDGRSGKIVIEHWCEEDMQTLCVRDTGIGMPPEKDRLPSSSLGLQLVHLLTKQLGGSVEIIRDHGTSIRIRFPREKETETQSSPRPIAALVAE